MRHYQLETRSGTKYFLFHHSDGTFKCWGSNGRFFTGKLEPIDLRSKETSPVGSRLLGDTGTGRLQTSTVVSICRMTEKQFNRQVFGEDGRE